MQRLFAQPVTGQDKFPFLLIVDGESEHAAQLLHTVGSHFFVEMNDYFRIGLGVETMPAPLEFRAKLRKVVDFAVKDDPRTPVLVEHRLVTAGKINDAEAPHPETRAILNEDAFVIRTPVDNPVAHLLDESIGDAALPRRAYNARNSAHIPASILSHRPNLIRFFLLGPCP